LSNTVASTTIPPLAMPLGGTGPALTWQRGLAT